MKSTIKKSNFPYLSTLIFLTLLTFWTSFQNQLVKKEDLLFFEQIEKTSFLEQGIHYRHFSYQPLTRLSHWLDHYFWGKNLFGFRLGNILFHLTNGILFFYLLSLSQFAIKICFIAALLFLLHPLQVENLLSFSGRGPLLGTFFFLFFFLGFDSLQRTTKPEQKWPKKRIALLALLQFSAHLAWEYTLLAPFLLFFWSSSASKSTSKAKKTLYLVSLGVALIGTIIQLGIAYTRKTLWAGWQGENLLSNLYTRFPAIGEQVLEFFFPLNLCTFYTIPLKDSPFWTPLAAFFLIALLLFGFSKMPKSSFWLVLFFLPFLFTFLPFPQKFVKTDTTTALSLLGFSCLFARLLGQLDFKKHKIYLVVPISFIFCFSGLSFQRTQSWKDTFSLWKEAKLSAKGGTTAQFQLGMIYLEEGQKELEKNPVRASEYFKQARKEFEEVLTQNNIDWETRFWCNIRLSLLWMLHENNDQEALIYLKQAEKLAQKEKRELYIKDKYYYVYQNQAQIYDRQGNAKEAQKYWKKVIQLYPKDLPPRLSLAISQNQFGEPEKAINTLVEVLAIDPKYYLARLQMGKIYFNLKEYKLAKQQFQRVLGFSLPTYDEKETLYNLALSHHFLREYKEEKRNLKKVLAIAPDFILARMDLAQLEKKEGEIEKAIEQLYQIMHQLEKKPQSPLVLAQIRRIKKDISDLYLVKGKLAYDRQQFNEAENWIEKALIVTENHPNALYEKAFLQKRFGKLYEAKENFKLLLKLHPNYYEVYRELGYIALQENKNEAGIEFFRDYLAKLPLKNVKMRKRIQGIIENHEYNLYLAKAKTLENPKTQKIDPEKAKMEALALYFQQHPPSSQSNYQRVANQLQQYKVVQKLSEAKEFANENQFEKALDSLEELFQLEPKNWQALLLKGILLIKVAPENFIAIEKALQKAMRANPQHPQAYYVLGSYYLECGDKAEKAKDLEKATIHYRNAKKWFVLCLAKDERKFYTKQTKMYLEMIQNKK